MQEAQAKASQVVAIVDVKDLNVSESPEDILLSAVSGDQSRDRTDCALVVYPLAQVSSGELSFCTPRDYP